MEDNPTSAGHMTAFAGLASRWSIWSLQHGQIDAVTSGPAISPSISERGDLLVASHIDSIEVCDLPSRATRTLVNRKGLAWVRVTPNGSRGLLRRG